MLLWLLRGAYAVLLIGLAVFAASIFIEQNQNTNAALVPLGILLFGGVVLLTDVRERQKQMTTISAIFFGLLLGLLLGLLFSAALEPLMRYTFAAVPEMVNIGRGVVTVICCYVTISTLL